MREPLIDRRGLAPEPPTARQRIKVTMGRTSTTATPTTTSPTAAGLLHAPQASPARFITVAVPIDAIGPLTVTAPPPALISPDVGAEHVGCTRAALVEHLSWMAHDPRWRDRVIVGSRKRRLAAPEDVVASMRERYSATPRPPAEAVAGDDVAVEQRRLEADLRIVDAPGVRTAKGRRLRARRGADEGPLSGFAAPSEPEG